MTDPLDSDWRRHVTATYRRRAAHYDRLMELYRHAGYRERTYRRRATRALELGVGDTVVDVGCGTGVNFELVERSIGPHGRLVGVDLTDAMLSQARRRVDAHGWRNVTLVQADAVDFSFPSGVDAILSTYALSLIPACADVIARGSEALRAGGRWVVLDVRLPENAPAWVVRLGLAALRPFAATDEWAAARPWDRVRSAMRANLVAATLSDMFFGFAYLGVGRGREERARG